MKTNLIIAGLLLSPATFAFAYQMSRGEQLPIPGSGATGQADGAAAACDCNPPGVIYGVEIPHDPKVTASHGGSEYPNTSTGFPAGESAQTTGVPCGKRKRVHYTFTNCEVAGEELVCDTPASWTVKLEDC